MTTDNTTEASRRWLEQLERDVADIKALDDAFVAGKVSADEYASARAKLTTRKP